MSRPIQVGDTATVSTSTQSENYLIRAIGDEGIYISSPGATQFSLLVPVNDQWQVYGYNIPHYVSFTSAPPPRPTRPAPSLPAERAQIHVRSSNGDEAVVEVDFEEGVEYPTFRVLSSSSGVDSEGIINSFSTTIFTRADVTQLSEPPAYLKAAMPEDWEITLMGVQRGEYFPEMKQAFRRYAKERPRLRESLFIPTD